jgi:hypothetical protein
MVEIGSNADDPVPDGIDVRLHEAPHNSMTIYQEIFEPRLSIYAQFLWEQDGQPEGKLAEYGSKARAMLDEEALLMAPIDEATAARGLLNKPPLAKSKQN